MTMKKALSFALTLLCVIALLPLYALPAAADAYPTGYADMRARAEAIINYKWTPNVDIATWNNSTYNGSKTFKAGQTVTGMPYSLFVYELGVDSLLSLSQFKQIVAAKTNKTDTAYCVSVNATRTGPRYGSCCATFVSEVFGGNYMSGENPRYDSVYKIRTSPYTYTFTGKLSDIRSGDALCTSSDSHIIWVGDMTDKTITIYEQTPPVARKKVVARSTDANGYFIYNGTTYKTIARPNGGSGEVSCNCSTSYAGTYVCTTQTDDLNIRSGHGSGYNVVGGIPSGATVTVTKANGEWAHVTYNGISGYASMTYLKKTGNLPEPSCGCSTAYAGTYIVSTNSGTLNVRKEHSSSSEIVGELPHNATVIVTKASGTGSGNWAHVSYNGITGYASMAYLTKVSDATCDHKYTAQTKKAEALKSAGTCKDAAVYYYSCSLCGAVEKNASHTFKGDKDASNHAGGTTTVNVKEADHKKQTDGYSGDVKCSGCGKILTKGKTVPAGEHTSTGGNVATCLKKAVCDLCGAEYGEVKAHSFDTAYSFDEENHWFACKTEGCTEKKSVEAHTPDADGKCTKCGYVNEKHDHVKYLEKTDTVAATCTSDGTAEYWTCTGCGKLFADDKAAKEIEKPETVPMTGHDYQEKEKKEPTCAEAGYVVSVCTKCGDEKREESGPTAHVIVEKEAGGKVYHVCSVCGFSEDMPESLPTESKAGAEETGAASDTEPADEKGIKNLGLWIGLGAVLVAGGITAVVLTKKKKDEE